MKLITDNTTDEINLMITDEMKNLDDIEMKTMMKERKIIIKRLWNDLDEFEMNELEIKINAQIEILKNEEKKIRNIKDCLKNQSLNY